MPAEYHRTRYRANPARQKAATDRWRKKDPAKTRVFSRKCLLKRRGLTVEQWDQKIADQGFVCAVCLSPDPGCPDNQFRIDHDHVTGRLRGLLCHHCNVALGHVRDDPARLLALATYLEMYNAVD